MSKDIIDILYTGCWLLNALLFIPQILLLLKKKNSSEVSLLMFLCFNLVQVVSIIRGYIQLDYLTVFCFSASFITSGTITILIIIYRYRKKRGDG